jgi:hypothetical protein
VAKIGTNVCRPHGDEYPRRSPHEVWQLIHGNPLRTIVNVGVMAGDFCALVADNVPGNGFRNAGGF